MKIAPVAEIKTHFSAYLKESEKGPVVVTRNGKPVAVFLARIIHEPSLPQMQGAAHEAVVPPLRMRCNTADAVRSTRPTGEE